MESLVYRIPETYRKVKSVNKTSELIGIDYSKIYRTLKKFGEPINGKSGPKKVIQINAAFFNNIDNEKTAYWLGFISADGCVRKNKSGSFELSIHLSSKDVRHLKQFLIDTQSSHSISTKIVSGGKINGRNLGNFESVRIRIIRKEITDALQKHGIVSNKTQHGIIIPTMSQNLLRHWVRGFVDGDGSFWRRRRNNTLCFAVVSPQKSFLENIKFIFKDNCMCPGGSYSQTGKNCWRLSYEGKQAEKIHTWLYKDANVFLERKQKAIDIIGLSDNNPDVLYRAMHEVLHAKL